MSTYYSSNEAELERLADAAKSKDGRLPAGGPASSSSGPPTNPTYQAAMRMLEQFKKQNS